MSEPPSDESYAEQAPSVTGSAHLSAKQLHILHDLAKELNSQRASFRLPRTLVFQPTATLDSPRLAFSATNKDFLAYEDYLVKMLTRLDAVDSCNDDAVRMRRKQVVREVERELEKMDTIKRDLWESLAADSRKLGSRAKASLALVGR